MKASLSGGDLIQPLGSEVEDPYAQSLINVLVAEPASRREGDVAGLLRSALRSRSVHLGAPAGLVLQRANWLPEDETLGLHGIDVARTRNGDIRLGAKPWKPDWVDGIVDQRVFERRINRYTYKTLTADPRVYASTGFEAYRSTGQASAVRAACTLPPGQTLLVNLPTGAGKSLAFEMAFANAIRRKQACVLVVPTTALALDHEARLAHLGLDAVAAYHGGLTEPRKQQIRTNFRDGLLSIVIASPEAVLGPLSSSIHSSAERGSLAMLVVDEAHMVSGWGTDFRPEFQLLGGFSNHLAGLAPHEDSQLRTLLLSATVTNQTRDDLRNLFGGFAEVAAVWLRPEPEYWLAECHSKDQKFDRVVEAVRHLPRPMIIYTSLREEAKELFNLVKDACALARIRLIRGGDLRASNGAEAVISDWAQRRFDVVVATSAFGLGIVVSKSGRYTGMT